MAQNFNINFLGKVVVLPITEENIYNFISVFIFVAKTLNKLRNENCIKP